MNLNNINKIFMIGIGGAGMKALALLLRSRNISISGADREYETLKQQKAMQYYELSSEKDAQELLSATDLVIYSDAVTEDHPLRKYAEELNIPSLPYQEALGQLASHYKVIAVTGTHGKSSTTALLAHILTENGLDPNVIIGAAMPAWNNQNARVGKSDYLVVEADEYREHFLTLKPLHAIITTIDFDHPDYYTDLNHVKDAYNRFIDNIDKEGFLVAPEALIKEHADIKWPQNTISPEVNDNFDNVELALPGEHMRSNAMLAITIATKMGISSKDATQSLRTFQGLGRRFELLGQYDSLNVISDYGHHPEELLATIKAANTRYSDSKIAVIVEIHMPDRLSTFFNEFVKSLKEANTVIFAPVFVPKGREKMNDNTEELLQDLIAELTKNGVSVQNMQTFNNLELTLKKLSSDFDIALCFSAGLLDAKLRQLV